MTTAVIIVLTVLLVAAIGALAVLYRRQQATANQATTNPWPVTTAAPNKGVLLAIANLPSAVRSVLEKTFPEVTDLTAGTVSEDEQYLIYKLKGDIAVLTLWPFSRKLSLSSTRHSDVYCTISYAGGFKDNDLDQLTGFYGRLLASETDTVTSWASQLNSTMVPHHVPATAVNVPLDTV